MRVQTFSEKEKREHHAAWLSSGLSKSQFCRNQGLNIHEFRYWHKCFKNEVSESSSFAPLSNPSFITDVSEKIISIDIKLPNRVQLTFSLEKNHLIPLVQELCHAATVIR